MTERLLEALGPVLTRWTMGGGAAPAAPAAWRDALGEEAAEAELRLLALSGHFLGSLTLAEPAGEIHALAPLPRLAKPPVPEALRPRARRLLQAVREPSRRRDLLDFLDARGWTLHPGDWLPGPNDEVPDVYTPWQDWAASADSAEGAPQALSAESWEEMAPAARRVAFASLRRQDPDAAALLLGQKIGAETADERVRLLSMIRQGLTEVDRPLLEGFANDRAPRVQATAAALLGRLGHGATAESDAAELAAFFEVQTKGFLRRTRTVVPQPPKTPAQRNRRFSLMQSVPFPVFAASLELTAEKLIAGWPWGADHGLDRALAGMAARSSPDAAVVAVAEALMTGASLDPYGLHSLLPRLAPAQRRSLATRLLNAQGGTYAQALIIAGAEGALDDALRTAAGIALLQRLQDSAATTGDPAGELLALGLLTTQAEARRALERIAAVGLVAADPRLDMLRLNAALDNGGTTR
ncbi:hypothetical protein BKE38_06880 [Pseudoroseomonas deserti]|uniref:Uncharacterized protein n=1 Tax=Teichococcus deserti TaxID=1817963 RepID=A0A1V2H7A9_9PROT|nr:DUF5691 domain-containing protein [Pseudoroseomonas deserti]ONG56048.1 hypothetical protein BKE38_06880 [Pseudoroseomonas deserti]